MKTGAMEKRGILEWFVFFLLCCSLILVSFFHEPWFDEAQSWQIARYASFQEMLFWIPHYEGHPPLWYFLLSIPAKLGVPYEVGLHAVSCLVALLSGWLILFYSPFPRIIRVLLPFHYFLFYQYGVVSRPYGYLALFLILLAIFFPKRKERPWLFVFLLGMMCLLCAYGMALACGIAVAWLVEICQEKEWKLFAKDFWKDRRFPALGALLLLGIFTLWEISPRQDTVIAFAKIGQKLGTCLLYTFFMMLPDSSLIMILKGEGILRYTGIGAMEAVLGTLLGLLMVAAILLFSSRRRIRYFVIPYFFFAIFSGYVYFATHHMGIVFLFCLFWLWINWKEEEKGWLYKIAARRIRVREETGKLLRRVGLFLGGLLLAVPVFWSVVASCLDVQYPYYYSRSAAAFLKDHHLENLKILCEWSGSVYPGDGDIPYEDMNVNVMKTAVSLAPYFETPVFYNFNYGKADQGYILFQTSGEENNRKVIGQWKEEGLPDVIVGSVDLNILFPQCDQKTAYSAVYKMQPLRFGIWKMLRTDSLFDLKFIYVRRDLLEEYGLEEIAESSF